MLHVFYMELCMSMLLLAVYLSCICNCIFSRFWLQFKTTLYLQLVVTVHLASSNDMAQNLLRRKTRKWLTSLQTK